MQTHGGSLDLNEVSPLYFHEGFEAIAPLVRNIPSVQVSTSEMVKRSSRRQRRQRRQGLRILYPSDSDKLPENGYKIIVNENGILLKAHKPEHMISAIQTLHQLRLLQGDNNSTLPFVVIEDEPRFAYRGMHLDVSSQFMPLDFIKKYVDLMGLYKFNHFHWQLANGAGWRLESHQYPELTETTAWRSHADFTTWEQNGRKYLKKAHPNAYGGYYTREEVREIVQYAAARGITVVPEVGFGSPDSELLTARPQLSQNDSEKLLVIKNILSEIVEVFPSNYIHVGVNKTETNTADPDTSLTLIREHLQAKGRAVATWNEPQRQESEKNTSLTFLSDHESVTVALNKGQNIILSLPGFQQASDFFTDPRMGSSVFERYVSVKQMYDYVPVSPSIPKEKAKYILGIQGNLWTTSLPFPQQVEHTAFPMAIALAEIGWTTEESRSYEDFARRLQSHYMILKGKQVNYTRPSFHVAHEVVFDGKKLSNKVTLTTEQYESTIRYTTDGRDPSAFSTLYHLPVELSGTATLKAATFIDTVRVSPVETVQLDVHKAIGKRVKYNNPWSDKYPAQKERSLTNGEKGSLNFRDGRWQGFGQGVDIVIDLDRREEINSISTSFLQIPTENIFFPQELRVFASENGKTYREVGEIKNSDITETLFSPKNFKVVLEKPIMARYIKIIADNVGEGLLFADEVVLY